MRVSSPEQYVASEDSYWRYATVCVSVTNYLSGLSFIKSMSPFSHGYGAMTVIIFMLLWGARIDAPGITEQPSSSSSDFPVENFNYKNLLPLRSVGISDDQHETDLSLHAGYRTLLLCLVATCDYTNVKLTDRYRITRECITSRKQSISSNHLDRVKGTGMESSRRFNETLRASLLFAQNISKKFLVTKQPNLVAKAHKRCRQRYFSAVLKFKIFPRINPHLKQNKHTVVDERDISETGQSTTASPVLKINSRKIRSVQKVKLKGKVRAVPAEPEATFHARLVTATGSAVQHLGLDRNPINIKEVKEMLKREAQLRHLSHGAEIAYMCLVGLLVTMLWTIWYLGGFRRCHYQPQNHMFFSEEDNYLSVREVLERRKQYLPMLQGQPEWQDVLGCSHGGRH